ncbi:hypothetical protein [Dyadobacter fanqingshengii]|uniref:Uncharacterized protein n=1 Tax=Dyadobacter fanqingshengii TaxID=2906443 RepID=A0A9X1PDX3_9BACT|nr:hypothetical protein [Dyadobacter fanqingshengii]MCF0042782.1 hypothetical protein [Dyadobacter fanqingshengii]MCF2504447.1 hypothetical protein [Dyadobacter fanqingshengii]USJ35998.1 hypothetical protein NFI81_25360 [Dyadobacter fanqingshengii]
MKNIKTYFPALCLAVALSLGMASCKEEDPFLDVDVAPVLVDIVGAAFGAPIASEPTVGYQATAPKLTLSARLLELDKTNILDNTKGIDSIPVPNVAIKITLRTGAVLGEVTSNAQGLVTIDKTWAELGVAAPKAGAVTKISWTGTYKGIAFTRYSQVQAN